MTYSMQDRVLIFLSSVEGLGVRRMSRLLAEAQTPEAIFSLSERTLREILGPTLYERFCARKNREHMRRVLERLEQLNVRAITRFSPDYPPALLDLFDPPYVLYVKGDLPLVQPKAAGNVGSRHATRYGRTAAKTLATQLAGEGVCVISGLARGVDSCAHLGALAGGGKTIAVLGCGVDVCYPPENGELMDRIGKEGALVSEYLPGTPPLPDHFRQRNRIIAGLSQACVLVEGAKKSGAMITVNFAMDAGREVFAVPGPIDSPLSESPNALIRDGAHLMASAADLTQAMGWADAKPAQVQFQSLSVELSEQEQKIVQPLLGDELTFEELMTVTGFDASNLNSLLTMLSLRGIIKQHPGGVYSTR